MVWKLRDWQGGDPAAQVQQCLDLGLSWLSPKIVDGADERWEAFWVKNQNADLLPVVVPLLRAAGVQVVGWGWTYATNSAAEAAKTIDICHKHGIDHYQIDAESHYVKDGSAPIADAYCVALEAEPKITHSLCSYRYPLTYQAKFPVMAFAPYMEAWCPQVYFLGDSRPDGGAIQLEISKKQYDDKIRELPYFPIFPTYPWQTWRASYVQLTQAFAKAVELGCPAAGVWDLTQATTEQLNAISDFEWPETPAPPEPEPPDHISDLIEIASGMRGFAGALEEIAEELS